MLYQRMLVVLLLVPAVLTAIYYEFRLFLSLARVSAREEIRDARRAWREKRT